MAPRPTGRPPGDRVRRPAPVLRHRLPSGRGATEQPNAASTEVLLAPRFWLALVVTGVAAGVIGAGLMALLFTVERLAFGTAASYQDAVEAATPAHRVVSLLVAGAFGGAAWYLLRRFTPGRQTEIDDVVWSGTGRLSVRRSVGTSVIAEIVIGLGASLGREAAPKLMGGVSGGVAGRAFGLTAAQQRLLIACGGGAGLACVYNVPLGGALFTAEVLLGTVSVATMLPALACSATATVVAWVYLPVEVTYPNVADHAFSPSVLVFAVLGGPVFGLVAVGYIRLVGFVSHYRVRGAWAILASVLGFGLLGVAGIAFPQLFGNGKDMAHDAFLGVGGLALLLSLAVLKPLVTALMLGTGASGGLFTPVMSTGAVLGAGLGVLWSDLWPGAPVGAYAMVGAAALIGSAMQAPVSGLVLVLELTSSGFGLMTALAAATVLATVVARWLDGYSIYSARLPARAGGSAPPGAATSKPHDRR